MSSDVITPSQKIPRRRTYRWVIIAIGILLILGTFIALFVVYFTRYQRTQQTRLSYPDFNCSDRSCGCPNRTKKQSLISKIVGGEEASPYIYPWLVTLTDRLRVDPFCAGFIISSNAILTAAHCLKDRNPKQVQILARIHDLRDFQGNRYDIEQWIIHPDYHVNDSMHLNDIALIRISTDFAEDLRPCCLPPTQSSAYPRAKTEAVVGGWGKVSIKSSSRNSPVLQHVVMPIVDHRNNKCRQSISDKHRQVCAGYDSLPIDSCSGDSGAPLLVVEHDHQQGYFVAAGLVSYGNKQCDASISSGVYTRVSFYHDWISKNLVNKYA